MLIRFTQPQIDYVVNLLATRPYAEVAQLMADIGNQVRQQQDAEVTASEPVPTPPYARLGRKPRTKGNGADHARTAHPTPPEPG